MWNHIMMAFQVNHGQCDSIIFPKTFSFTFLYLCLADIRILYIHQILESSQKIIIKHNLPSFPSCTLQKRTSPPLQFGQEENIPGHSTEKRAYWFVLKLARMFLIPTSRNRMINNFITVNITQTFKRYFRE